jgi:hypothetical protein
MLLQSKRPTAPPVQLHLHIANYGHCAEAQRAFCDRYGLHERAFYRWHMEYDQELMAQAPLTLVAASITALAELRDDTVIKPLRLDREIELRKATSMGA